jgi:5-methylcytosine-specific restriction endonuclease McrA
VLAGAKSDGTLTAEEGATIDWLRSNLPLRSSFVRYLDDQLAEIRLLTDVSRGRLPSLNGGSVERRAGECLHYENDACYRETRMLKSGSVSHDHHGRLSITDERLVFVGTQKTVSVPLGRVVAIDDIPGGMSLSVPGKGSGTYFFAPPAHVAAAILRAAVRRANQTLREESATRPTRHIPRDVRQRVWQIYGGRCADCQSEQYLEFDHIVPVAKGGGNTEQNVQLLCRKCNLTKRDNI